tara:strand:- start:222 stop:800 length:579 start_codon:yes stop_codon:yes gene_type:complete
MAITINGDGTISGINVGGLPDGIVDTDTLADNAATAAKLTTGNVIQTVNQKVEGGSMTNITTGTATYTGLYGEITPHLSNSKILILVNLRVYMSGGGNDTGCGFTIQRKIGSGTYSVIEASVDATGQQQFYYYHPTSGGELSTTFTDTAFDNPGTNSDVVRYQVYGSVHSGGTISLTSSTSNHYITLMEIKQ